jgi:hypothetical protein
MKLPRGDKRTFFVKPTGGRRVYNPDAGKDLLSSGATVNNTTYWRNRLRAGIVELAKREKAKPKQKKIETETETFTQVKENKS